MAEDTSLDPMMAAIRAFTSRGYDATTVDDIADAAEISRSTFFRRFKSKDDVVFADHEILLRRVDEYLETTSAAPLQAVCGAARLVFEHHVKRKEISLARFTLLHNVASLRDRELITSHRYERAFTHFLGATLSDNSEREYLSVAFSAAVVALHNAMLRKWLLEPEKPLLLKLDAQFKLLTKAFTGDAGTSDKEGYLVAVFDRDGAPDDLIEAIRSSLH